MTMYKRVIYRQKHPLFVISGVGYRHEMNRIRSAPPPEIESFTEKLAELQIETPKEKGLVLKNKDGMVITEEMLANFTDSSSSEEEEEVKPKVSKEKKVKPEEKKSEIEEKKEEIVKESIKEEEKEKLELKEEIKNEVKEIIKEEIKETVKEEIKKESKLYTFKLPDDLKEAIEKEAPKRVPLYHQPSVAQKDPLQKLSPKPTLFGSETSVGQKEGSTPYIYQMPTITTPKAVYKKPDQGLSRKKLLTNRIRRTYKVNEILQFKERTNIPLFYERSLFMKAEMSEAEKLESKVYDTVSLYRRELNRLAKSTYEKVIREIRKLTVKTAEEMRQIAEITFEKAIKEVTFQDLYIGLIRTFKSSFYCIEEGGEKEKTHSVFWSTICHLCKDAFTNKASWVNELALKENSFRSFEERCKYEDEFEEKEGERIKKKGRILGTIKLFSNFFNLGMISDNFIHTAIFQLKMNINDQENVEMLCHLFENCGEKLMKKNEKLFNEVIDAMKRNINNYDQKVKFVILNLIELKIPAWKVSPKKSSLFGTNTFSGLKIVRDAPKPVEEKKEINYNSMFKNIRLTLLEEEVDTSVLKQNIIKDIKDKKTEFLNELFSNISENFEMVDEMILFFLSFANFFKKEEIMNGLKETFELLDDLKWDAPFAYTNFYKLILYMQSEAIISEEDISEVKISFFEDEKKKILKQWLKSFDNQLRIERVSSDDKVKELLDECVKESGEDRFKCYLEKYNLTQ